MSLEERGLSLGTLTYRPVLLHDAFYNPAERFSGELTCPHHNDEKFTRLDSKRRIASLKYL